MTNFERIKNMTVEETDEICRALCNSISFCSECPVNEYCEIGSNGFKQWLESEVEMSDDSNK